MRLKKIYFVGIKGVGMASLAIIAKQAGLEVAGSDLSQEFITDKILNREGVVPLIGFNLQNIKGFIGDSQKEEVLIISTSAHNGFNNPETKYAREQGFKVLTHGQAVGAFMDGEIFERSDMEGISVAGCHGKTTISAMLATFLSKLREDPSYTVGTSEIFPIGASGHYGKGKYFVAEADEYVSEMNFDKTPKFLYQNPKMAIINNVDFDHPDFYKNIEAVEDAFLRFARGVDKNGFLVINGDDQRLQSLKGKISSEIKIITFGVYTGNDFYISDYRESGLDSNFNVFSKGLNLGKFNLSMPGFHNAKNALSTLALLLELGFAADEIGNVFPLFMGTKRRLEILGKADSGAIIIDDYAHHPQEIKTSLFAVKEAYPGKKILCIFQPHTYSRTNALLSDFISSFSDASFLILLPVYASLRENEQENCSINELLDGFKKINKEVVLLNDPSFVVEYVNNNFRSDDYVVVTMGAGDVYSIANALRVKAL